MLKNTSIITNLKILKITKNRKHYKNYIIIKYFYQFQINYKNCNKLEKLQQISKNTLAHCCA